MNKRIPILLGIVLIFVAAWLLITPSRMVRHFIDRLDDLGYDLQLRTRLIAQPAKPATPIAIIDIDDASLKSEGRWPWPRDKIARLVDVLHKQGASVIAFDVFFSEGEKNIATTVKDKLEEQGNIPSELASALTKHLSLFDTDSILAKALAQTTTVLAIGFLPREQTANDLPLPLLRLTQQEMAQLDVFKAKGYIGNIDILQKAAKQAGFINAYADTDGILRHVPLVYAYKNDLYPSLALQAVLSFLHVPISLVTPRYGKSIELEGIKLGSQEITTDARGQVLIPFIGRSYTFPYFSASEVLKGNIPRDALLGKILFVGTSATGLGDLKATAIESAYPGVEVQATIAHGLLVNNFSYRPAWTLGANFVLTIILGLIAAFTFPYLGPRTLGLIIIFVPAAMLFVNNWIWGSTGLILSFLIPVLLVLANAIMNIIYGYLFETRKREHLKEMFGQYVPAKHIDEMLKSKSDYGLRGESREMSVLFADIRSFTTISETMSASELVDMLNTLFTPMTEAIFKHRGTIDKYIGDLIMAFWGAPLRDKNHARHALQTALEMQSILKKMAPMIAEKKWPEIHMGIGINSGQMSVGDMGSRYRRNYTVLGDNVNLGSRVEGLSKFYGVDIVVTESTQHDQPKFVFRKLDRVKVKGKQQGVEIFELICSQSDASPELLAELTSYHAALDLYFQQKWTEAEAMLQHLHAQYPHTKIYSIYLQRIAEIKERPVPPDWDGIYAHTAK